MAPPPTKTASGAGSPASASGAPPSTTSRSGTPRRAALVRTRAARTGSRSTATVRQVACARIHSIPTDPAPAPTSQRSSPGRGASRESALARRSRLVSWPSWSKTSSGRPTAHEADGVSPSTSRHRTWSAATSWSHVVAVPTRRSSSGAPRSESAVIRVAPWPDPTSSPATAAGVEASEDSTTTRRPGASSRSTRSTRRPTTVTTAHVSSGQPIRARARATDETAGTTSTDSGPSSRTRVPATPETNGSPDARTTGADAAWVASSPCRLSANGRPHASRRWPSTGGSSASWRSEPSTTDASVRRRCTGTGSPVQPSAPRPTTTTRPSAGWEVGAGVTGGKAIVSPQLRGAPRGENLGSRWESGTGPLR